MPIETKVFYHKGQIPAVGKKQNLFFLYGGKNQKNIAQYLDQNQTLIGIIPPGRGRKEIKTKTVEAFADIHSQQILKIQSQGPFFICGFSFGGLVAFEIAQRFIELGHKVDMLMLIDTFPGDSIREISGLKKIDPPASVSSMNPKEIYKRLKRKIYRLLNWKFIGDPNRPLDFLCNALLKFHIPLPSKKLRSHYMLRTMRIAKSRYKFKKYNGKLTYFKASKYYKEHEQYPKLWQSVVLSDFKSYTIPGEHLDLLEEPNVKILAKLIKNIIKSKI